MTPAAVLARAWEAAPVQDFGRFGDVPVTVASWLLAAKHRIDVPQISAHLVCVALSAAKRHALWLDRREAGAGYAPPGSVRIVPAGARAEVEVEGLASAQGHFAFFHLYVEPESFRNLGIADRLDLARPGAGETDAWLESVVRKFAGNDQDDGPLARLEQDHLALAALAHLARHYGKAAAFPVVKGGLASRQTKRVLDYLEDNLAGEVTVAQLAGLISLSPYHFARAFRISVGLPPHRYLTQRRLERAKALLRETQSPVTEIALALGFTDSSYLARLMKRETGLTPAEYRRRLA